MRLTPHDVGQRRPFLRLLGYVPDDDLGALYQLCSAFSYPSLYEGFGLPLLEALQAGAPSVTSNVSALREVGGDGARYVDPRDVRDIRAGLRTVLESAEEREALRRRGMEQASKFNWGKTARQVLDVVVASGH
jgi:glycosyltransferase involved in cell wall biosynthesis